MRLGTQEDLVEAARELGPVLREHADQAERERRPPAAVIDALREAGLFRLYTPRPLGGLEVDPITCAHVLAEISAADSAAGWTVMVANGVDWWCARLADDGAEEIYAHNPDAIIASAFHPPMRAREQHGGFRISGRNPLASNISDADWVFVPAVVMDAGQPRTTEALPRVVGAILRADQCEIIDTWRALGMRGTDSNDIAINDAFVPAARTFPITPDFEPGSHYQGPLYRMPAMGAVVGAWAPIALAIARAAIIELTSLAERKTPFASTTPLRERSAIQAKLGHAEALVRSARALLYDSLDAAWERTLAGHPSSLRQKGELLMAAAHAVQSSAHATELMYRAAGTTAIYARSPLERHYRDLQVLKQHGFFSENRYETIGQLLLGLPPDLGFVAF